MRSCEGKELLVSRHENDVKDVVSRLRRCFGLRVRKPRTSEDAGEEDTLHLTLGKPLNLLRNFFPCGVLQVGRGMRKDQVFEVCQCAGVEHQGGNFKMRSFNFAL